MQAKRLTFAVLPRLSPLSPLPPLPPRLSACAGNDSKFTIARTVSEPKHPRIRCSAVPQEISHTPMSEKGDNPVHPVVCILGMHRSGTSCLTGSLQQAGLHLGKYHSWNRYNQKGNRENQDVVDFHEQLLAANDASWERPPRRFRYTEADVEAARALISRYRGDWLWGFKDPRALLALELWQKAAGDLRCVGIFRHPRAVAESVSRRSGGRITLDAALGLWAHYNRLLYQAWRQQRFPMLCFDWEEDRFQQRIDEVMTALGLDPGRVEEPFYSSDLMHFQGQRWEGIPWRVRRLYQKLAAATEQPVIAQ